jgi:hypothetical protein
VIFIWTCLLSRRRSIVDEPGAYPNTVATVYHRPMAGSAFQMLDAKAAEMVEGVCDAIVPGSARVGPAVYIDALLARMDEGTRGAALAAFAAVAAGLPAPAMTPDFFWVRALAIEAFYSDFVAPGVDATGAWAEIDFNTPLATRLAKDWSYLGIG